MGGRFPSADLHCCCQRCQIMLHTTEHEKNSDHSTPPSSSQDLFPSQQILASNKVSVHNFVVWEFTPWMGGQKPPKP